MRLREREPDPRAQRELDAVDAALRGERVEPEFDDLAAIATELRESRPALDRNVATELDAWAADGFSRPQGSPSADGDPGTTRPRTIRGRTPSRRRWLLPAFGAAATAVLVIGVAVSQMGQDYVDERGPVSGFSADDSGTVEKPVTPQPASPELSFEHRERLSAQASDDRIQDQDAGLSLTTEENEVDDVTGDAALVVERYDGIVDEQTVSSGGSRDARGYLKARIPVQNFNAALAEISDLAEVKARTQGLTDITKPFVTAEKRFANAQARVNSLLEQLAAGEDPVLREQLRVARQQLASARADLRANKQEGNYADLTLSVAAEDGGWSIGDAADDAVGVLEWIGGALLIALAVAIPAGALCAAIWFGTGSLRRRRRESVLDD